VTHDVEFAAQIADRVVILSQGEIIADGPAAAVLGASPLFAPQMARLFPGRGWLTVDDVLAALQDQAVKGEDMSEYATTYEKGHR
jgi:energy-coupling factor transport system ATP-binding protein